MCVCLDMLYGVKTTLYRYDELKERERERERESPDMLYGAKTPKRL